MFSDKTEELFGVLDLFIEELHKILLCLIVQLLKSHLIVAPKPWWTAWACTVFFLLSGHQSVFLTFSYMMAVDFHRNSLSVISVFSAVKCFEGSVPAFKPSVLKTAL